ncbi:MAG: oligoribonuclease (3-_5 exoribonuclease) [Actinomycetia bacterium]|nr:oligoribonuclease (3->5 exoribonuclease) [Actinomycetes bacterium]
MSVDREPVADGVPVEDAASSAETAPDPASDRLVWIDLEMTGLDVDRHVIVEIGVLVTDGQLEVIDGGFDVVVHQPPEALAEMDDFVRRMHTRSGLLPAIEASTLSLEEAGAQALEYIRTLVPTPGVAPMCGNSIGTDRRFLSAQLRELDDYLHYRSVDVSSFKELCRRWYPDVYAKRPDKGETHRALEDITESIAELQYYRAHMLRAPEPGPERGTSA